VFGTRGERGEAMNEEQVRLGVARLKQTFTQWRNPPVELPAESVIGEVVRSLLQTGYDLGRASVTPAAEAVAAKNSATPSGTSPPALKEPNSDFVCQSCGSPLMDCGLLGVECPNRHCPDNVRLMRQSRVSKAAAPVAETAGKRGLGEILCFFGVHRPQVRYTEVHRSRSGVYYVVAHCTCRRCTLIYSCRA
jgi:hypothetical protein